MQNPKVTGFSRRFLQLTAASVACANLVLSAACSPATQLGHQLQPSEEFKRSIFVEPTKPLKPVEEKKETSAAGGTYDVYEIVDVTFAPDEKIASISARATVKSTAGRETVDLVGVIRDDGSASLLDLTPLANGTHRLVGEAYCADRKACKYIILNVLYNVAGKVKKKQFASAALLAAMSGAPRAHESNEKEWHETEKAKPDQEDKTPTLAPFTGPETPKELVDQLAQREEDPSAIEPEKTVEPIKQGDEAATAPPEMGNETDALPPIDDSPVIDTETATRQDAPPEDEAPAAPETPKSEAPKPAAPKPAAPKPAAPKPAAPKPAAPKPAAPKPAAPKPAAPKPAAPKPAAPKPAAPKPAAPKPAAAKPVPASKPGMWERTKEIGRNIRDWFSDPLGIKDAMKTDKVPAKPAAPKPAPARPAPARPQSASSRPPPARPAAATPPKAWGPAKAPPAPPAPAAPRAPESLRNLPVPPAAPEADATADLVAKLVREAQLAPLLNIRDGGKAFGNVNNGRLRSGTQLPNEGEGFKKVTVTPGAQWGTGLLTSFLRNAAALITRQFFPGVKLHVGDVAKQNGGPYGSHNTHDNGLAADLGYVGVARPLGESALDRNGNVVDGFPFEKTWKVLELAYRQRIVYNGKEQPALNIVFMSPGVKKGFCSWAKKNDIFEKEENRRIMSLIYRENGHHKHFHVSMKCSPYYDPTCRHFDLPESGPTGCD